MKARLASAALIVAATAAVWACDHDAHPIASGAAGGAGTAAGTGGKGGKGGVGGGAGQVAAGGSAGSAAGEAGSGARGGANGGTSGAMSGGNGGNGTSGNGGSGTGGAAGEGDAGEGGAPATGGTSGSGGNSGTAGTGGMAGLGGTAGDTTTGEGGEWSGPDDRSLDELCSEVCADQANVSCGFGSICEGQCVAVSLYAVVGANEYRALLECQADHLTTENYENYCDRFDAASPTLAFEAGTPCEDELCAWTCVPGSYLFNIDVRYDRCNACL